VSGTDPLDALGLSMRCGAAELYVIRHADAVPVSDESFGIYDDYEAHPLSGRGVAQAEAIAARCAALGLDAVYASPIRRARETAEAIAREAGLTIIDEPDLREIAIGAVDDGLMTLRERLEWLALVAIRDGSWSGIAGTESSASVRTRMLRAFDAVAARHPGGRVALVSHAGSINAALGAIAGTPHDFVFPLANASLSVVRAGGGRRLIMSANDTSHLRAIPARARP
jgi:probable phosphoglycerate mutase